MNHAKEDKKIIQFDLSRDRILDCVQSKLDDGDYLNAIVMLNKCVSLYGNDEETYEAYIDIYEESELSSMALNVWFSYLHAYEESDKSEMYEGIAVNYMNLGMDMEALLYYKKFLEESPNGETNPDLSDLDINEIFSRNDKPNLRIVYPPKHADYNYEITGGLKRMNNGDIDSAIRLLKNVDKQSDAFLTAGNLLAVCYVLKGDSEKGDAICKEVLARFPDDVQTLATLAALYTELGEEEKSKAIALDLCGRKIENNDSLYQVITVACGNGLDKEAVEKLKQLSESFPFDKQILYSLAVGEYKIGDYKSSKNHFYTLCSFYPQASVAKYYYTQLVKFLEEREKNPLLVGPEIMYAYRVPDLVRGEWATFLIEIKKKGVKYVDENMLFGKVSDALSWCFDELNGQDKELQGLAIKIAVQLGMDEFLQEKMLRYDLSDMIKMLAMYQLVLRNKAGNFNLVINSLYRKYPVYNIRLGRKKRKMFLESCADLSAKYVIKDEHYAQKIASVAEGIYNNVVRNENEDFDFSNESLSCAIYLETGIDSGMEKLGRVVMDFKADLGQVAHLINYSLSNPETFATPVVKQRRKRKSVK